MPLTSVANGAPYIYSIACDNNGNYIAGGGAGSTDVIDRAARLLGVVTLASGQVIDVTDRAGRLVGVVSLAANSIIDVSDRAGRLVGQITIASGQVIDVIDRAGRLLGNTNSTITSVQASLAQTNQIPVSNSAPQGEIAITSPPVNITASSDTTITFASVVRRIRIQNESANVLYWRTDAVASTASSSVPATTGVEWIAVQTSVLHLFMTVQTAFNVASGVKVVGYA